jgi:hypothetical protein
MRSKEIKQREAFFKELGEILARRHGQNYYSSYQNQSRITTDETAARFGRYLRAARVNAGLTVLDLSTQSRLSTVTIIALEQGLILACDIKSWWLRQLAKTLNEAVEDFDLILGRQTPNKASWRLIDPLILGWESLVNALKVSALAKPAYATTSAIVLCIAISAFLLVEGGILNHRPTPQPPKTSFVYVGPEQRLNIIKAEFGLESQVFILPAYSVAKGSCCIY